MFRKGEGMRTREELKMLQSLSLEVKIAKTQQRIREWVTYFGVEGVYVSFSGGKDSTVLLHIVREMYPDVEAVFVNTGLEYPEIQRFVKTFDNVKILYPKMKFYEVIQKYGYPVITKKISRVIGSAQRGVKWALDYVYLRGSAVKDGKVTMWNANKYKDLLNVDFRISNKCCDIIKKKPMHDFQIKYDKKAITGQMAAESNQRENNWLKFGCNMFDAKYQISNPLSFWREQDILQYITDNNIKIASLYGDVMPIDGQIFFDCIDCKLCTTGLDRTGCIFCGFGAHLEKGETRFQRLKRTHPKQYDYCINGGGYDVDGLWKPNKNGMGMGHVFDVLNSIYGEDFIKYK